MGLRARSDVYVNLPVEKLHPHPDNPRKDLGDLTELAESIKKNGIMQNLTVIPDGEGYKILIGHRRCAAAKLAGLKELPCRIAIGLDDREQQLIMLEENMERRDLTVWEQAESFQMVLDLGGSVQDIEEKTGFSRSTVYRRLEIAKLDKELVDKATGEDGFQMTLGDFDELAKIKDVNKRNEILKDATSSSSIKWGVSNELARLKRQKNADDICFALEQAGAKKGPKGIEDQVYSNKWDRVLSISLESPSLDEITAEEVSGAVYAVTSWNVSVMRPRQKSQEVSDKKAKEKEIARRCREMKKIQDRMTEDRNRKIRGLLLEEYRLKEVSDQYRACDLCWKTIHLSGGVTGGIERYLSRVLWDENYFVLKTEDQKKADEMEEKLGTDMQMLIAASETCNNTQSYTTTLCDRITGKYNEKAGRVHRLMMMALNVFGGFKYDAEEMALIDGTHELYMKEEPNEG